MLVFYFKVFQYFLVIRDEILMVVLLWFSNFIKSISIVSNNNSFTDVYYFNCRELFKFDHYDIS